MSSADKKIRLIMQELDEMGTIQRYVAVEQKIIHHEDTFWARNIIKKKLLDEMASRLGLN